MSGRAKVLICDDDNVFHLAVKHCLKNSYDCRSAYNCDEALAILKNHPIDILLLDIQMRTPNEGLEYLPRIREIDEDIAIIMTSGRKDFETVRKAMQLGAIDYVPKDFNPEELKLNIEAALSRRSLLKRGKQQNFEVVSRQKSQIMIGESPAILSLKRVIAKIRDNAANVVITGETGTGKEVVARQLRSNLPDGTLAPFVAVDSSTIQSTMAESILFGHEKGAFTGAEKSSQGIFEQADGGIVYFDEIANMPLEIQAKLLRVIQEREVTRLGSPKVIELRFRVVCATNQDLEDLVKQGRFKEDLLQRLNVLPLSLPPLRKRVEDVPLLLEHATTEQGLPSLRFTSDAIAVLQAYAWPGNVRELLNVVAYVAAMSDTHDIDVADLPPKLREAAERAMRKSAAEELPRDSASEAGFYDRVAAFERDVLAAEYAALDGNISQLALKLGMDRSHLYTKLREHGIHPARRS